MRAPLRLHGPTSWNISRGTKDNAGAGYRVLTRPNRGYRNQYVSFLVCRCPILHKTRESAISARGRVCHVFVRTTREGLRTAEYPRLMTPHGFSHDLAMCAIKTTSKFIFGRGLQPPTSTYIRGCDFPLCSCRAERMHKGTRLRRKTLARKIVDYNYQLTSAT